MGPAAVTLLTKDIFKGGQDGRSRPLLEIVPRDDVDDGIDAAAGESQTGRQGNASDQHPRRLYEPSFKEGENMIGCPTQVKYHRHCCENLEGPGPWHHRPLLPTDFQVACDYHTDGDEEAKNVLAYLDNVMVDLCLLGARTITKEADDHFFVDGGRFGASEMDPWRREGQGQEPNPTGHEPSHPVPLETLRPRRAPDGSAVPYAEGREEISAGVEIEVGYGVVEFAEGFAKGPVKPEGMVRNPQRERAGEDEVGDGQVEEPDGVGCLLQMETEDKNDQPVPYDSQREDNGVDG